MLRPSKMQLCIRGRYRATMSHPQPNWTSNRRHLYCGPLCKVWPVFKYDKALKNVFGKSKKTQEMTHSSLPVEQKNSKKINKKIHHDYYGHIEFRENPSKCVPKWPRVWWRYRATGAYPGTKIIIVCNFHHD